MLCMGCKLLDVSHAVLMGGQMFSRMRCLTTAVFCAGLWSVLCHMHHRAGTRPFKNQRFCTQHLRVWWSCKATPLEGFFVAEGLIRLLRSSQLRGA